MKKIQRTLIIAVMLIVLALSPRPAAAQSSNSFANMDPGQIQKMIQQRLMDTLHEQLAVTNADEWSVIEARLSKVVAGRMEAMGSSMGMMGRMRPGGGGGNGAGRRFPGFGQPSPEAAALQTALDGNAPIAEVKEALAKVREARKQKQADLVKAQEELRQVLSTRQEATLVSMGMLD